MMLSSFSRIRFASFALVLCAAMFGGCSKNDSSPTSPTPAVTHASGTYTGVIADTGQSGLITLSILSSGSAFAKAERIATIDTVIASVTLGPNSFNLTGTYNTSNDSLYLAGFSAGESFTFAGKYMAGMLQGSWSDSQGDAGNFTSASASGSAVTAYVGVTTSGEGNRPAQLDLAVKGSNVIGVALIANQRQLLTGTVSGDAITLYALVSSVKVRVGAGTFDASHISATGTYNVAGVDSGTWSVINYVDLPPPLHAIGTYTGVAAATSQSGIISLNVSRVTGGVSATSGVLTIFTASGSVIYTANLNGSYSTSNDSLHLRGLNGSDTLSFAGSYANGVINGSWTESNGDYGDFAALAGSGRRVPTYLGLAYGTGQPFCFVVKGSVLVGVASIAGGRQFFTGSVSSSAVTMVNVGSGTIDPGGSTASGTYNIPDVDNGIWSATLTN